MRFLRLLAATTAMLLCITACAGTPAPVPDPAPASEAKTPPEPSFGRAWEADLPEDIRAVAVAPSGEVLVSADKTLHVLAKRGGRQIRSASACRASGDGALRFTAPHELVLGCSDAVIVFSWPDLARKRVEEHRHTHRAVVAPGRFALSGAFEPRVRIYSSETFAVVDWFDAPQRVKDLAFSPDGSLLAVATDAGLYVHDVRERKGKLVLPTKDDHISSIDFSADGTQLVATIGTGIAQIDARTGAAVRTVTQDVWVRDAALVADGNIITTGSDGLHLWSPKTGNDAKLLGKDFKETLAASPSGRFFCASTDRKKLGCFGRLDPEVERRALAAVRPAALPSGAPRPEPVAEPAPPPTAAPKGYAIRWRRDGSLGWMGLSPDSQSLVTVAGALVEVRSLQDGSSTRGVEVCVGPDNGYGFSKTDSFVVICENRIQHLEWPSLALKKSFNLEGDMNVGDVAAGRAVVDIEDTGRMHVYSLDSGKRIAEIKTSAPIQSLRLSPDGNFVVFSAKGEGTVIYDTRTRTTRKLADGVAGPELTFSPDGKKIFGRFGESTVQELDVAKGAAGRVWDARFPTDAAYMGSAGLVVVGHDGLRILSSSGDMTEPVRWIDRSGLAVKPDGSVICGIASWIRRNQKSMADELVCFEQTR